MGLIRITSDMTDSERTAVLNANLQYLQLSTRLRKYPIGMIVAFDTDIDPNKLYGGTWERIKGAFIWGIDDGETAGVTGGEKTHTLTEAELPAIDGRIATAVVSNHGANGVTGHAYGTDFGPATETIGGAKGAAGTQYGYGYKFGSGQAHNNMPPFYGAYIWRKTAHGIGEDPTLTEYEAMMKQMNDALSETKTLCNLLFSNALRGSASGEAVRLSDITPNEHTLGVKVSGKNLLPNPNVHAYNYSLDYKKYNNTDEIFLTAGTYSLSASANCPTLQFWNKETKQPYTVDEAVSAYSTNTYYKIYDGRALGRSSDSVRNMWFTLKIDALITLNSGYSEATSQKCQIEIGSTATPYTPYISLTTVNVTRYGTVETDSPQTYTPTADGTVSGVKSLYPITTLMTDTAGVIINAEYNKDLNKAFAELQQAILSMGGNV